MSSILTNNSAMVALDTLRNINKNLASVQSEISTGKSISNAKDNAAIWAISTVMSTDVESFKQISDSLNLGSSTVGVARVASEKVTGLLQDMKELIVTAQGANVDRTKIQTQINEIRENISSVVGAAQFNGLNLIDGSSSTDMKILSSLDRSSTGTVSAAFINVARHDLSTTTAVDAAAKTATDAGYVSTTDSATTTNADIASTAGGYLSTALSSSIADGANGDVTIKAGAIGAGDAFTISVGGSDYTYTAASGDTINDVATGLKTLIDAGSVANLTVTVTPGADPLANDATINFAASGGAVTFTEANLAATTPESVISDGDSVGVSIAGGTISTGDTFTINVGDADYTYTAQDGDTSNDVAAGLKSLIDAGSITDLTVTVTDGADPATDAATITLTADGSDVSVNLAGLASENAAVAAGGLGAVSSIDVSTEAGATAALTSIETLLQTSIDAAAGFGSSQTRIENQSEFVNSLVDSMTSGIGSLVDADMEAASAKLQALQVQQQLGVQSLSIANQAPQQLLSLFR